MSSIEELSVGYALKHIKNSVKFYCQAKDSIYNFEVCLSLRASFCDRPYELLEIERTLSGMSAYLKLLPSKTLAENGIIILPSVPTKTLIRFL